MEDLRKAEMVEYLGHIGLVADRIDRYRLTKQNKLIVIRPLPTTLDRLARVCALVTDWDDTASTGNYWPEVVALLPPHLQDWCDRTRRWYFTVGRGIDDPTARFGDHWWDDRIERSALSRAASDAEWIVRPVEYLHQAGVTRAQLREIAKRVPLRGRFGQLLSRFDHRLAASFGIRNMIEMSLEANGLQADVIASKLLFDEQDRVLGVQPGSIVVSDTKPEAVELFLRSRGVPAFRTMVMGDNGFDGKMMFKESFNILVLSFEASNPDLAEYQLRSLGELWSKLDAVLVGDDFAPLLHLMDLAKKHR